MPLRHPKATRPPSWPSTPPRALGARRHRRRFRHRRARCHGRRHRAPLHQPLVRRRCGHAAMGGDGLLAHPGRLPASRWLARRPLRAAAHLLRRYRLVRHRLGRLRLRPQRRAARGRPRRPGRGRRAADPGQPGHHPSLVPGRRPLPRYRRLVGLRRRGHGRRSTGGGLSVGRRLVALGLLHQCPRGRRRPRAHGPPRARDP